MTYNFQCTSQNSFHIKDANYNALHPNGDTTASCYLYSTAYGVLNPIGNRSGERDWYSLIRGLEVAVLLPRPELLTVLGTILILHVTFPLSLVK
jgi:hypothetical protein